MKKILKAKTIMAVVGGFALANFMATAARAVTITPDFITGGSGSPDPIYSDSSAGDQLQSGDLTISNFSPGTVPGNNLGPVSGGPGSITIQPVSPAGPVIDGRVPDSGSTVALFGLAFLGVEVVRRRLKAT